MNNNQNGRVNIIEPTQDVFQLYDKIPVHQCTTYRDAMIGNWTDSTLSKAFFSGENIQIVQNGIRAGVYERSNGRYIIGLQDVDIIKVVMRSIFLQHSANMSTQITEQIRELNKLVLDYLVPNAYSGITAYVNYKRDVSSLSVPMDLPIKAGTGNKKTLELKNFF